MIAFLFLSTVPMLVRFFAQCRPIQKLWYPETPGNCWNPQDQTAIGYYQGGESFHIQDDSRRR